MLGQRRRQPRRDRRARVAAAADLNRDRRAETDSRALRDMRRLILRVGERLLLRLGRRRRWIARRERDAADEDAIPARRCRRIDELADRRDIAHRHIDTVQAV